MGIFCKVQVSSGEVCTGTNQYTGPGREEHVVPGVLVTHASHFVFVFLCTIILKPCVSSYLKLFTLHNPLGECVFGGHFENDVIGKKGLH